jgi:hypothetical protein
VALELEARQAQAVQVLLTHIQVQRSLMQVVVAVVVVLVLVAVLVALVAVVQVATQDKTVLLVLQILVAAVVPATGNQRQTLVELVDLALSSFDMPTRCQT